LPGWGAHSFSASGHKIHAIKGIALLWNSADQALPALLYGGGQERRLRSGTENMPGIMALAAAAEDLAAAAAPAIETMRLVKQTLYGRLQAAVADVYINGPAPDQAAPHILNLSFLGCRSEVLLHYLEQQGIYVSSGSACNSRSSKGSYVLENMGLPAERVDSALRFSFSRDNTVEEAELAAEIIISAVQEVRLLMGATNKRR
jgi:cysteine desulfurase